jgi:hypothetical protein
MAISFASPWPSDALDLAAELLHLPGEPTGVELYHHATHYCRLRNLPLLFRIRRIN